MPVGVLLYAAFALALVLAGVRPDPRPWGVHFYAFLPRLVWFAAALVLALFLVPAAARRAERFAGSIGAGLSRPVFLLAGVALASAPFFYLARLEFQFLGDGMVWVNAIDEGKPFHHFEPLAATLTSLLAKTLAPAHAGTAAGALSIALGPVYLFVTALLCRAGWNDGASRGRAWLLLFLHPVLLLYFGYAESYPLLLVVEVIYVLTLARAAQRRLPLVVPSLVLGLAIATHLTAIAWAPALLVLVLGRSVAPAGAPTKAAARVGVAGIPAGWLAGLAAVALALGIGAATAGAVGSSPARLLREVLGAPGLGGQSLRWIVSPRHGIDLLNEFLLLLAPVFVLLGGALSGPSPSTAAADGGTKAGANSQRGARKATRTALDAGGIPLPRAFWNSVVALLAGTLTVLLLVEPRIGGARDWDLFLPLLLPAVLLAMHVGSTAPAAAVGRALVLALVMLVGWLAVGLDAKRSAQRLEVLQEPRGAFSNFARGYANETLGIYYRGRDLEAGCAAWVRATQANPANPRYFNNLGMEELKRNQVDAACVAFRRTLELGMDEYFVHFNVANCDRQEGNLEASEKQLDQLIARWPQRWEGFSARGKVRLRLERPGEALEDLLTAARLQQDADTYYSMGLALEVLGRPAEARSAWERTLQLAPSHAQAREHLQQQAAPQPPPAP